MLKLSRLLFALGLCALASRALADGMTQGWNGVITGAGTFTANSQVMLDNTATAPTFNASYATLAIGGAWSAAPTLNANGQGAAYLNTTYGLVLSGDGSSGDVSLADHSGTVRAYIRDSNGIFLAMAGLQFGGGLYIGSGIEVASSSNPSIYSGATIGTAAGGTFSFNFTTTASSASTVVTMPFTASHGWNCPGGGNDFTTLTTHVRQTANTTTTVTFTPYSITTGVALSTWGAADSVSATCFAN